MRLAIAGQGNVDDLIHFYHDTGLVVLERREHLFSSGWNWGVAIDKV